MPAEHYKIKILGTGSYVPENLVTNNDLKAYMDTDDEWIQQRTGIKQRYWAADDQATSDLCIAASERAIDHAGIDKQDIDLLILATCSPDYLVACTSAIVQHKLGLNTVAGYDLVSACSGFVNALITASQFLRTGTYKTALVIGGEALSKILNKDDRGTGIIFGDGAGAAIIQAYTGEGDSDLLSCSMGQDGTGSEKLMVPAGCSRKPASHETIENKEHGIFMAGKDIYRFAVRTMTKLLQHEMDINKWTADDVNIVIPHQVNMRILESASQKTGVPIDKMQINIDRFGNTSAGSVPIALDEAVRANKIKRGDKVIFIAFGAGLTWSSASMIW